MANMKGIDFAIRMRDQIKDIAKVLPPDHEVHDAVRDLDSGIETMQKLKEEDYRLLAMVIKADIHDPMYKIMMAHMIAELKVEIQDLREEIALMKADKPVWEPGE